MISVKNILFLFVLVLFPCSLLAQSYISDEADLRSINNDLSGHYILTKDIVLSQEWTPIAEEVSSPFRGTLDGNGHIVRNLRINSSRQVTGFFGYTVGATIKNLGVENAEVTASSEATDACAGILIGEAFNSSISYSYISGGFVKAKGTAASFIGRTTNDDHQAEILHVYADSHVNSELSNAGGLVGLAGNISIVESYYLGIAQAKYACGGIVGSTSNDNVIFNCAVLSPSLKGMMVNRIVGEKKTGTLSLSCNYARTDMLIGNRNMGIVHPSLTGIKSLQGANIPYANPEFSSGLQAYTNSDITTAVAAFNDRFYSRSRKLYYENSSPGKVAAVWVQAIYFDMAMNAYKRTGEQQDLTKITQVFEGNEAEYAKFDWSVDRYPNGWFIYDDIMWWVIALARAYEVTGNEKYLHLSQTGFERVWSGEGGEGDSGSYDPVRGGMYWAWDNNNPVGSPQPTMGKMSCINYPTVISAMTLFNCTGDSSYLNRAIEIYDWSRNNLFDKDNANPSLLGRVADSKHGNGNPAWKMHVYNQATCIGAAVMMYKQTGDRMYLEDAILAADYTKNVMSNNGFMNFATGIEQGIYHAIFAQYIAQLIFDCGQYQYLSWLRYNIDYGWANRLRASGVSNNVTYKDYVNPAPTIDRIQSYDASGIPALMQVIPPTNDRADEVHAKNKNFYEKTLLWDFESTWTWSENDSLPKLSLFGITSGLKKKMILAR